jgi:ATPase subunit of ABC transporter with duplicated ATPase domains
MGDGELRGLLGMFGLVGDKVFQDASTLSGGEKTKLALAQLVGGKHNVLLLDEPTNNLDPAPAPRWPTRCRAGAAPSSW